MIQRQQVQTPSSSSATPTTTPKVKKSRPKDIDVLEILRSRTDNKPLINVAVVSVELCLIHINSIIHALGNLMFGAGACNPAKGETDRLDEVINVHPVHDAGKSTMMGHLLCLLGNISKKEQHKHKTESSKMGKGSFRFAWVLDETEEERERGVTIDVAQTRFETPKRTVNLLDAPGHKDFVPNMIRGASQADIAILVVDATPGEFEAGFDAGGQTREHVLLVRSLGVQSLVVAVNKMERVGWEEKRFREIEEQLIGFIRGVGFKTTEVVFVPVSGLEGDNLTERSDNTALQAWYSGKSLIEVIDEIEPPSRNYDKPFRLVITDVFKHPQLGLSVAGKRSRKIELVQLLDGPFTGSSQLKLLESDNWYSGKSLIEVIDEIEPPSRNYDKPFRLVITDVFKHPQLGLSVAGKGIAVVVLAFPQGRGNCVTKHFVSPN
eukprot:sb/3464833/